MKILVCDAPGKFSYQESNAPVLTKNHTILKIKSIGICGTYLHAFEGKQPFFNYPRILGHEPAGEIVTADGVPGFSVVDAVTFLPYFNYGHCIACRNGKTNYCKEMQAV